MAEHLLQYNYQWLQRFKNLMGGKSTMKKSLCLVLSAVTILSVAACGSAKTSGKSSAVQSIIKQAEGMSMEELGKKAIEESNGKMFYGVGNSSRGKSALPLFIKYLQSINPEYKLDFEWQQPKNNKIFDQLTADSLKSSGTFAMTLIQDGNQIESKMVRTGILDTFIPKEWAEARSPNMPPDILVRPSTICAILGPNRFSMSSTV